METAVSITTHGHGVHVRWNCLHGRTVCTPNGHFFLKSNRAREITARCRHQTVPRRVNVKKMKVEVERRLQGVSTV